MKARVFRFLSILLVFATIGFFIRNILRTAFADPPTRTRSKDIDKAQRTEAPTAGQDFVMPLTDAKVAARGRVEPTTRPIDVAGQVNGLITRIHIAPGDSVKVGAMLVQLDDEVARSLVAAAAADLKRAEAELDRALKGSFLAELEAAKAERARQAAIAKQAKTTLRRLTKVTSSGGVSRDRVDQAELRSLAEDAALTAATARVQLARARQEESIALSSAAVAKAKAALDQTQAEQAALMIRAPIAGEILEVAYLSGEFYRVGGSPAVVMGDTSNLRARIDVDERDIGRVAKNQSVTVIAPAFPDNPIAGRVTQIGRQMGRKSLLADEPGERTDTRVLEVLVDLEPNTKLVVGQRVDVYFKEIP